MTNKPGDIVILHLNENGYPLKKINSEGTFYIGKAIVIASGFSSLDHYNNYLICVNEIENYMPHTKLSFYERYSCFENRIDKPFVILSKLKEFENKRCDIISDDFIFGVGENND